MSSERVAISLSSDACYTRLIEIPDSIKEETSKDFIEDIVFKTYSSVSSIEDLEKYCSNLIKKLSKEEAKSLGIGTYKLDEETKKYTYENKKSFFIYRFQWSFKNNKKILDQSFK